MFKRKEVYFKTFDSYSRVIEYLQKEVMHDLKVVGYSTQNFIFEVFDMKIGDRIIYTVSVKAYKDGEE